MRNHFRNKDTPLNRLPYFDWPRRRLETILSEAPSSTPISSSRLASWNEQFVIKSISAHRYIPYRWGNAQKWTRKKDRLIRKTPRDLRANGKCKRECRINGNITVCRLAFVAGHAQFKRLLKQSGLLGGFNSREDDDACSGHVGARSILGVGLAILFWVPIQDRSNTDCTGIE